MGDLIYVGKTFPIHDAPQKVTGSLVYLNDMVLPNMVYAKLLLSSVAHGIIKKIDTSRAEALPGVCRVFTHLNTPTRTYSRYRIVPGQNNCLEDERLFTEKVRFVGDRVAAVVATSLEIATEAISLIDIDYEVLPALCSPEEALSNDRIRIHSEGNLIHEFDHQTGEQPLFQNEWLLVETSTNTQKVHHAALETHSCIANFESSGKLTIWAASQGVFGIRTIVADLLDLAYNQVRVIKVPMGGSFGGRQEAILEPITAYLAKEVKRPVKVIFNRVESMIATMTRPATSTRIKTTVSRDGMLKACAVENVVDAGAYATSSIDNAYAMSKKISRLYRIPCYSHQSKIVYTNTPVAGGARGWGAPEIITAMELHMDAVAKRLAMNPLEYRLKNLVHPYDYDEISHISLGNARIIDCLEKGAAAFGWNERYSRKHDIKGRYRRGVGLGCAAHKNGMYGGFPEHSTMTLKMNEDGTFILNTGLHDVGCGTLTSIQQITAEVLEVSPGSITVLEADTEYGPYDFGSYGSRVTYICGACAYEVAMQVKEKLLDCASLILGEPKERLDVNDGYVRIIGQKQQIRYRDIATTAKVKDNTDIVVTHTYHGTSNPGAYGVHFAEAEVDTETGMVRVTDYLAAHDIGKAINPGMVEGQIEGSVQNGIGYALYEELIINREGTILNGSFKNYHVVNAPDMPRIKTLLLELGGDDGPYGAKSIGEVAFVPVAAAVINAVNNALGTSLSDMPLTPGKILTALKTDSYLNNNYSQLE
jgi:CO/xanthine dehydrogenase Mo-binding subunit